MVPQNYVILVDENDREIGIEEKLVAHQQAKLHRAFSIFIARKRNQNFELLLQQRQHHKYHSPGLWTNTCCSHPMPGEDLLSAVTRRLKEEMGIVVPLEKIGVFKYKEKVGNDLYEHEMDHVFIGFYDQENISINSEEVADFCWMPIDQIQQDFSLHPEKYTAWFKTALDMVEKYLNLSLARHPRESGDLSKNTPLHSEGDPRFRGDDVPKDFTGFSKLNREERLSRLIEMNVLTPEDVRYLNISIDPTITTLAEKFIENVIGCFPLPLGIATHFKIDAEDYVIPMAVEETSIIAAVSRTAKWIRECGEITTETIGNTIIGQIQIARVQDFDQLKIIIENKGEALIKMANEKVVPGLVSRGGGVKALQLRKIMRPDQQIMAVIHVLLDPCDAMGANVISQVCEFLKEPIQQLTQEKVTMCIISNLTDTQLTRVKVIIHDIDPEWAEAIEEASLFAYLDPYRAATHNKGVLNGIDPVLIATGNDWRAVEAGVHAYAARSGSYRSITHWKRENNSLVGILEAPISVGTVGGVTRLHPTAQLALRILNVKNAAHLARIVGAVGLVQNLGALRALTSEGIVKGHMKLHINNLLLAAGATAEEIPPLKKLLEAFLNTHAKITLSDAKEFLTQLRQQEVSS